MATARKFVEQGGKVRLQAARRMFYPKSPGRTSKHMLPICSTRVRTAAFVQNVIQDFGGIDVLVNAAGIIASGSIENTTLADYDLMMNINVRSLFSSDPARVAINHRKKRKYRECLQRYGTSRISRCPRLLREQSRGRSAHTLRIAGACAQRRPHQRSESWCGEKRTCI
jgi:NAD(P)-dependent dehydrogenase (short-subunit alcohol dehydrogenase family)